MADEDALNKSMAAAGGPPQPAKKPKLAPVAPPKRPGLANVARAVAPASHKPAAVRPAEVEDALDHAVAMRFAVVGAGQGGGKIAQSFWDLGYRRVAAYNTTDTDFAGLAADIPKLSLDISGAAKDAVLARNAFRSREEDAWELISRAWGTKVDCALVCAGLGGGTGSGTVLPLVQLARKYLEANGQPARVGVVVSLPDVEEGQKVCRNAVTAFRELVEAQVSPIIVIDNAKVDELYSPPMSQLLPKSNQLVTQLLHLFNQLAAAKSPHITFDRAELAQLLDGGIVVMGSADLPTDTIKAPADVAAAVREQLAASVLADVDLGTGRKAACVFVASTDVLDTFGRDYFAAGFTTMNRIVGSSHPEGTEVVIHRGLYPESDEGLQCYTMVSELAPPAAKLAALAKQAGLPAPAAGGVARHLNVD